MVVVQCNSVDIASDRSSDVVRTDAWMCTRSITSYALRLAIRYMIRYPFVMANVARVRAVWAGAGVTGPGVSTFYFNEIHSGFVSDVATYFNAWSTWIPTGITVTISNTGDLLDVATGQISGTWTDGGTAVATMGGAGVYAQGVGARVKWSTAGIRNGRRVRGSTFMVPTIGAAQQTD